MSDSSPKDTGTSKNSPSDAATCRVCGVPSNKQCSLCGEAKYCSPEHIRSDWPSHQIDCYVKPPPNNLPGAAHLGRHKIDGILFPEDEDAPRTIKVRCLMGYTTSGQTWQTRNLKPYIPDSEKKGRSSVHIDGALEPMGGVMVGGMAEIFFRNASFTGTSKVNQCIQKLTKGKTARPWAGPVIAFRRTHLNSNLSAVMDKDLLVLVSYFKSGNPSRKL
ncbi:hypothetical protein FRB93_007754 [Tulasnella sp. JGI-2019a]|nr:hypothetical protein FRB93_007754 [Tulasnella sp. JGI-2019a]